MEPHAVASVTTISDQMERWLGPSRSGAMLAAALGLLALVLATVGVYGVIAYSVEQRQREIGVRLAVGAAPRQIVRLVLRVNARPVLTGLVVAATAWHLIRCERTRPAGVGRRPRDSALRRGCRERGPRAPGGAAGPRIHPAVRLTSSSIHLSTRVNTMEADLLKTFVALLIGLPLLSLSIRLAIRPAAEMVVRLRQNPDSPRLLSVRPAEQRDQELRAELAQLRLEIDQLRELVRFDRELLPSGSAD
jgi:hypothetical protein